MKKKFTLFNIIFLYEFFLVNIIQHHRFAQIFGFITEGKDTNIF
jgi:hypothetical protein